MRFAPAHATLGLAVAAAIALAGTPVAADMLANGDVEAGPVVGPTGTYAVAPGSTELTSWAVAGGSVTIVSDAYFQTHSGQRCVQLSATGPGAISQTFATADNAPYRLRFWLTGDPFTTPVVKHLRVQAGGVTQDFSFDTTPAWHWSMAWTEKTLDFTGTGSTTTLTFTSLDAGSWGPVIDYARVEAVTVDVGAGPVGLALAPVFPDPLRGAGHAAFTLPRDQDVRLSVVDVQGREIQVLARGVLAAGPHDLSFSPRDAGARAGLYFLVLRADGRTFARRFTVLQ